MAGCWAGWLCSAASCVQWLDVGRAGCVQLLAVFSGWLCSAASCVQWLDVGLPSCVQWPDVGLASCVQWLAVFSC